MVLFLLHELDVVLLFVPFCSIENQLRVEHTFLMDLFPVGFRLANSDQDLVTGSLADHQLLSEELCDFCISLLSDSLADDERSEIDELSLILEEHGNITLLVPDEEVLAFFASFLDLAYDATESSFVPFRCCRFDHCVRV